MDNNVDGTIALGLDLKEGDLVVPVDHVAVDRLGLLNYPKRREDDVHSCNA